MNELADRVAREKEAYDGGTVHAESGKLQARFHHVFECPNSQKGENFLDSAIREYAAGKDILDYGCYDGWMVPRYREMQPRSITGLDISESAIEKARITFGLEAKFYVGDAHAMPFPDDSFDLVVGRAILHHLDLDQALAEIRRVLRRGGKAVFIEPLADNPGAKLLRFMTPRARTSDEKPLTRSDIRRLDVVFGRSSHYFLGLVSVPVAMLTSLTSLAADNVLLRIADRADRWLAHTAVKYWMRQVILIWHKA